MVELPQQLIPASQSVEITDSVPISVAATVSGTVETQQGPAAGLKRLYGPAQPGTSPATIYTVPVARTAQLQSITVCNTTAIDATITISIGSDAAATRIVSGLVIPANGFLIIAAGYVLTADEVLQASQGTASALTLTINGTET